MRPACPLIRRAYSLHKLAWPQHRGLLTLAIETSCDDTSVAVLEKHGHKSQLHFHSKITSDNRIFRGVHPLVAQESHQKNVAKLVSAAIQHLPVRQSETVQKSNTLYIKQGDGGQLRKKPDFVTVTRGPGMFGCLSAGLDTAKGIAVAWQVPLLGVNHMQAHALTPRLVSSLEALSSLSPVFPFVSLLVSGGHTMLVHSLELCNHRILAGTIDIAIGDVIDKCARDILPEASLATGCDVMYGGLLEKFAFPNGSQDYNYAAPESLKDEIAVKETGYGWHLVPPLSKSQSVTNIDLAKTLRFSYSGFGSSVNRVMLEKPDMQLSERRVLARETMRVAFEHLASRLLNALTNNPELKGVNTVVVSGGVASNQFLKHLLRLILDKRGYKNMQLMFPPPSLCTDNAAMIAWTGMEMWEAGWRNDLTIRPLTKWPIDPEYGGGGILGAEGWVSDL